MTNKKARDIQIRLKWPLVVIFSILMTIICFSQRLKEGYETILLIESVVGAALGFLFAGIAWCEFSIAISDGHFPSWMKQGVYWFFASIGSALHQMSGFRHDPILAQDTGSFWYWVLANWTSAMCVLLLLWLGGLLIDGTKRLFKR